MSQFTYDLLNLDLPSGTYNISVKAKAEEFLDSESSNVVEYTVPLLPEKGNLISMNVDGSDKTFRVLKINGAVAEVFAADFTANTSIFASSGQTYAGSALDVYLNTDWYNTLNSTAKAAIVDKTFQQDKWYIGSSAGDPVYPANHTGGQSVVQYVISLSSATFGESITRHVYALSVQDILDYLDATPDMTPENTVITSENISMLLSPRTDSTWLSSAVDDGTTQYACYLTGNVPQITKFVANGGRIIRPAFQIDLRKIDWSFVIY